MTGALITHLRHVAIAAPDLDRQLAFYRDLWGLTPTESDQGVHFLAAEGSPEQFILRLRRSEQKRLDLVSFGAASTADVDALAADLGRRGVRIIHEPRPVDTPGGGYGFRFFDCDGRTVELSAQVETRVHRKVEAGEDIPVRLSHVVLNSQDIDRTRAFYEEYFAVLDLTADFTAKTLSGTAELTFDRRDPNAADLVLDTRDLAIDKVEAASGAGAWMATTHRLDAASPAFGSALHIAMPAGAGFGDAHPPPCARPSSAPACARTRPFASPACTIRSTCSRRTPPRPAMTPTRWKMLRTGRPARWPRSSTSRWWT